MIEHYEFGRIVIDGDDYKDIIIKNGKVKHRHTDDKHSITGEEVGELIKGVQFLVLGKGHDGCVNVKVDVYELCEEKKVKVIEGTTQDMVEGYNKLLKEGKKVSAIMHATC